ncbi:Uma2 family endonuclease [Kineosporia succinea]|uniref:Uma2 family endonuclease n=1 Tax=Kineosporia succinea TaxID=84632 RepID=A0ABT9NWT3_9ACTN|nr:Uma2 family endonuclease [Kineosporia succinea]MDP9824300.1 Uma2 family endonuclease [Kineosporia succinea]
MTQIWPDVVRAWDELEVPDGWRVAQAATDGILLMPLTAGGEHNVIGGLLTRQFFDAITDDEYFVGWDLPASLPDDGIYVPDLCVAHESRIRWNSRSVPMDVFVVAVEITTPDSAVNDRNRKWRAYARGGIPQYLLVDASDPGGPTVSLFSRPVDGVYQDVVRVPFGERIELAAPLSVVLDTGAFVRPEVG